MASYWLLSSEEPNSILHYNTDLIEENINTIYLASDLLPQRRAYLSPSK